MLLDSDVMIDILRGHGPAVDWLATISGTSIGLPGLVAMELIAGCRNQAEQQVLQQRLLGFSMHWPAQMDCQRAYTDFGNYRLSHNLGILDALIGHTAVGLGEPLATFNVKHLGVVSGLTTIQPY
jgi:predicted nucleic acid-binding protein